MGKGRWLRFRSFVDRWFVTVFVGWLLIAGVGAVVVHGAYVDPGTHQQQRSVDQWRANGTFDHGARVAGPTAGTPFEAGTTVRNRSVYFQRVMPVLSGEFTFRTPGAGVPVNLTVDRRLVVESTSGGGVDESPTVYWRDTRDLGTIRTAKPADEPATVPFEVNVTRTLATARNVSDRLDSPGEIQARIEMTAEATRQTEDAVTRRLSYSLPVTAQSGVYRVGDGGASERFADRVTVTVPNDPGAGQRLGGPLVLAVGLAGALALVGARYRGLVALSDREREWLAYRDDRAEYDEWITTVSPPTETRTLPTARAETLADLVDFAIDTESGVMQEPGGDTYHVVHDGYHYTFDAPPKPRTAGDPLAVLGSATENGDDGDPVADGSGDEGIDDGQ